VRAILKSKQAILNFVGGHPELTTLLAGVGITVAFGSVGRLAIHEVLASAVGTPIFEVDYVDRTPLSTVSGFQTANAIPCQCSGCHDRTLKVELHKLIVYS
jgi:hypothetical protein